MDYEKEARKVFAKLHPEMFGWVKDHYATFSEEDKQFWESIFPELRESEDERIKRIITDSVFYQYGAGVEYKDILDYLDKLEKQKEQKDPFDDGQFKRGYEAGYEDAVRVNKQQHSDDWKNGYESGKIVGRQEQMPTTKFKKGDWVVYDGILGRGILQVADVKDGRYTFVDNDSTLLAEDSDDCLRPLTPDDLKEQKRDVNACKARARFIHNILSGNDMKKMVELYKDEIPEGKNVVWAVIYTDKPKEQNPERWEDWKDKINIPYCSSDEQKPVEKQDYSGLNDFERAIHRGFLCAGVENVPVTIIKETAQDCLAQIPDEIAYGEYLQYGERQYGRGYKDGADSVKPVEWSEDDEKWMKLAIQSCEMCGNPVTASWLKSLRPHPSWKPSEEQMTYLLHAEGALRAHNHTDIAKHIAELYEHLKKLMEDEK